MTRSKKHFNKGHSPDKSECTNCGDAIDISKSVHQMHDKYDNKTHHFDIEGEDLATDRHESGEYHEAGMHCPSCDDAIEERHYEDGRREYHQMNNDYMRDC